MHYNCLSKSNVNYYNPLIKNVLMTFYTYSGFFFSRVWTFPSDHKHINHKFYFSINPPLILVSSAELLLLPCQQLLTPHTTFSSNDAQLLSTNINIIVSSSLTAKYTANIKIQSTIRQGIIFSYWSLSQARCTGYKNWATHSLGGCSPLPLMTLQHAHQYTKLSNLKDNV